MSCVWFFFFLVLLQWEDIFTTGSTSWPMGKYGLLKPNTGCLDDGWQDKGSLYHDTVDGNPSNNRSETLHIDGYVSLSYVITSFCIKTVDGSQNTDQPAWPPGKYCVYKKRGALLTKMTNGWIRMKNQITNLDKSIYITSNNNRILCSFPKVYNFRYLVLNFYCQTSGNKKIPISLPITKPFYLLPYGSRDCQQVKWMVATSEWIKYHTNNYVNRTGQTYGTVPYHEFGDVNNKGITMFYCYYESCKYNLNDTRGVFQSPGFPGKYPDGQLCSWRIMVPDNHTLHVHFTNFSLSGNDAKDNLKFFKYYRENFHLNDTFHGHHNKPFIVTATSDVLFKFLTNEEGNSTGFRAEYIVFKASKTTLPPPSTARTVDQHATTTLTTNTGILHTTTIPSTETKNKTKNSSNHTFRKYPMAECDGADTTILIVIPLVCLIVVAVVSIILYRWRSKKSKCEKCASTRCPKKDAMNPTYDDAGQIQIRQRTSTATMNTTLGTDDNDGQMYQALTRDQQPEYQAPDYSKQNDVDDPSMDSGYPEYHELEPMDNNVPDVLYHVLEGPDTNDGPSDDHTYQALDKETTHNPLYQSTSPTTMETQNPLYVGSVA